MHARQYSLLVFCILSGLLAIVPAWGQAPPASKAPEAVVTVEFHAPEPEATDKPLPINLPTALKLANARPIDIAIASQRLEQAYAQLERANTLWLPTIYFGVDYARHDGRLQDIEGRILDTNKSSLMVGAGPAAVFALSDAVFAPLAAKQVVAARHADMQTAANNTLYSVAEAYFHVQQARGELAGALDAQARAEDLVRRMAKLAPGITPPVEATRTRVELSRRRQAVAAARERWRTASAELVRLLRLDPTALVQPMEAPNVRLTLIALDRPVDELVPIGLVNRPELASQQAIVEATLARLKQEKIRPLIPSVVLRGNATNPGGTLAAGAFGGGINDDLANFSGRSSFDLQILWEFQNLGFGNRAAMRERNAENQQALLELFRLQDRVAADVVQAFAQVKAAADRAKEAELGMKDALDSVAKNLEGVSTTKGDENAVTLLIRPQEVVAAVQALAIAYADFYAAIGDYNRAQYRLYRALGHPAQHLECGGRVEVK